MGCLGFVFLRVKVGWGRPEAKMCPKRRRSIPGVAAPILQMQVIAPFPVGRRVGWSVDLLRFGHSGPGTRPPEVSAGRGTGSEPVTLRSSRCGLHRCAEIGRAVLQCCSASVSGFQA